ncbi:MAG: dTDP-4-dehydrorhamnose 3,5-epimerase family protein [Candidatus Doudnabacteria bacterium]|nr:dTDP-4-dehydrorhamnose 3,5-epimerase family protein [Candidatus Doudnabacteria bacterium]
MEKTTEFKVTKTEIEGLLEIDISLIEDARGWFQEKFQKAKLVAAGFPADFNSVQQNISFNKEVGVTRGIHAEPWEKYISIIAGKVFAVFVDLRPGNDFGKKVSLEIDSSKAVFVPRGVGNSFQTLEPNTYYQYLVSEHWSPEGKYSSVNLADPDLAIEWPISLDKAIISDKDHQAPFLRNLKLS